MKISSCYSGRQISSPVTTVKTRSRTDVQKHAPGKSALSFGLCLNWKAAFCFYKPTIGIPNVVPRQSIEYPVLRSSSESNFRRRYRYRKGPGRREMFDKFRERHVPA